MTSVVQKLCGGYGGPVCEIISFLNISDIFPNFMLVCKDFSDMSKIEFGLLKLRKTRNLSEEESLFISDLIGSLFEGKKMLNEKFFIYLLKRNLIDPSSWWSHPFHNDQMPLFIIFTIFGCSEIVDFCINQEYKIIEEFKKSNYLTFNFNYIPRYANVSCLKWFLEFYEIEKILGLDQQRETCVKESLNGANVEILLYSIEVFGKGELMPENYRGLFLEMGRSCKNEKRIVETFKTIFEVFPFRRNNYYDYYRRGRYIQETINEWMNLCEIAYVSGRKPLMKLILQLLIQKEGINFLNDFKKKIKVCKITNRESSDFLFSLYPEKMILPLRTSSEDLYESLIIFGQIEALEKRLKESSSSTSSPLPKPRSLTIAASKGYLDIIKLLLSNERFVKKLKPIHLYYAISTSAKKGYLEIVVEIFKKFENCFPYNIFTSKKFFRELCGIQEYNHVDILTRRGIIEHSETANFSFNHHWNEWIEEHQEFVELEYCKIVRFFLDLKNEEFDPNKEIVISIHSKNYRITLELLNDERIDIENSRTNIFLFCCHQPKITVEVVSKLLSLEGVDPSSENSQCLRFFCNSESHENLVCILKDGRVDPSVEENFLILEMSKKCYNDVEREIVELLLLDERVVSSVDLNRVLQNLFCSKENIGIIERLIKMENVDLDINPALRKAISIQSVVFVEFLTKRVFKEEFFDFEIEYEIDWFVVKSKIELLFPDLENDEQILMTPSMAPLGIRSERFVPIM